jgi:hypothetical protein
MRAESVAKSIQMLKGILDGKTYVAIARETGAASSSISTAGSSPGPDSKVCQHFPHDERLPGDSSTEAAMSIKSGRCSASRSETRSAI